MISSVESVDVCRSVGTDKILTEARSRLQRNTQFRGRWQLIQIDERDGILVLQGRLPSYYLKQLLQTTLCDIDGITRIDNQVDVFWPHAE